MTKTTYPDGTFETFAYDANGNNTTATDRSGLTVTMKYDRLDRLTEKKYPDGTKETYTYDAVGNVLETVSASGAKTKYTYDSRYRNTAITDALGNVTSFEYDDAARLTARTDAQGNTTRYEYDGNGNITKTTYADGNCTTAEYDARNRVTKQTDQNGNATKYTYDGADRLTAVTDAYGNSYSYGYDGNGNLVTVTDAEGHVTKYTHDGNGRVASVTNALGRTMSYTYDETGNLAESTDYAGTVTRYGYDKTDRLVKKTVDKDVTEYSYDRKGLLLAVTDKSGTVKYQYDKYDRLETKTDAKGHTLAYAYDGAGRLKSLDSGHGKTSYEYDILDRVTKVIDRNGKATVYEYDAAGNRSAARYPNGDVVTYTYDACQRLKEECTVNGSGKQLAKYSYGTGKAGERLSVTEVSGGETTEISYKYDRLNRLVRETAEKDGNRLTQEYSYDKNSNRTEKKVSVKGDITKLADTGLDDMQVTEGTTEYTYNALNQLITERGPEGTATYEYDANGNLTKKRGSRTASYTYDTENRLTKATVQQGNSVTVESYTYDYEGNRTSKTVNEKDSVYYVNDTSGSLSMVAAETDSEGNEKAHFTRGEELLSMDREGKVCYYHYDGHGNVRFLIDSDGNITDSYSYDAYGNLLQKKGDTENDFLYTGEQYSENTGLYYLRARYMDPSTGTFTSMDSWPGSLTDPVSLHKYLYANANPVTYTDPSGYFSLSIAEIKHDAAVVAIGLSLLHTLRYINAAVTARYDYTHVVSNTVAAMDSADDVNSVVENVKSRIKAELEEKTKKNRCYCVYTLVDLDGVVRYVGRTKDYKSRMEQHKRPGGKMKQYNLIEGEMVLSNLTKEEARGLEQTLLVLYHTANFTKDVGIPYYNFVNGVGIRNANSSVYYDAAVEYMNRYPSMFENFEEEELNAIKEDKGNWW